VTYRNYRPDRRVRRRRWLLVFVTIAAIVASIAFLVTRQTDQRGTVEFFAAVDEASMLHEEASAELESALVSIGGIPRQDLMNRLARITESARTADALLDIEVPNAVATSHGAVSTASAAWTAGVVEIERAITSIMDDTISEENSAQMQAAIDLLRVGDTAYVLFLDSLDGPYEGVDISQLEPITYVNPEAQDPLLYNPLSLTIRVSVSYDLALHYNVAVTGQLTPEPVGDRVGIPLIPYSETVDLTAIISNTGNDVEPTVLVELEVLNADTNERVTLTETITDLEGGGSSSVTFTDLDIEPGRLYQLKLTVTITQDSRPDDDIWKITFIRNGES
jgi:hypothetical protein